MTTDVHDWNELTGDLSLPTLHRLYADGAVSPADVVRAIYRRIAARGADSVWISLADEAAATRQAERLQSRGSPNDLPLYGVPFAVKDNIDVADMPTTAACPEFRYVPSGSAASVEKLLAAGAICIGKTNLDQFATGLCGIRSPYGAVASVFNAEYAAGGSSSGSAVAVGAGVVSFALGTDTGGSGRVPAGFNNVVGVKPTLGLVSLRGVVPNCRSLDTVSVFALTCRDGAEVLRVMSGFDPDDPFSRQAPVVTERSPHAGASAALTFGIPAPKDLIFFGDRESATLFDAAIKRLRRLGGNVVEIDFDPLLEAGRMMFEGPWVAERAASVPEFFKAHSDAPLPVTRSIMEKAQCWDGTDVFTYLHRLRALQRTIEQSVWSRIDALVVPTAATAYTIAELEQEPIVRNNRNGYYSYFVNLLDLSAVAVPNGFLPRNGVAMGITFIAPAWHDDFLATLGGRYEAALGVPPGSAHMPRSSGEPTL
ncbi:MAG TPA: allophanate hydrolase [Acetobacteraceae bacterium]